MVKLETSELDQFIAKAMGWSTPHPFSSSDTYIGSVKKWVLKQGYAYEISAVTTTSFQCAICTKTTDNKPDKIGKGKSETENEAFCLALKSLLEKL